MHDQPDFEVQADLSFCLIVVGGIWLFYVECVTEPLYAEAGALEVPSQLWEERGVVKPHDQAAD